VEPDTFQTDLFRTGGKILFEIIALWPRGSIPDENASFRIVQSAYGILWAYRSFIKNLLWVERRRPFFTPNRK
jgi:hypothetical protein